MDSHEQQTQYEPLSVARSSIALISIIVSLLYVGPLLLYTANQTEFHHFSSSRFLSAIGPIVFKALLIAGLIVGISKLIKPHRVRTVLDAGLLFITASTISYVSYLPLSVGKLDGVDVIEIDLANLVIGLAIGTAAALWSSKGPTILFLLMIGPFITSTLALYGSHKDASRGFLPFSKTQKNVLLVSLDNLQSSHVSGVLSADATSFNGFVFYPEVTSVAPFSELSTLTTKMGLLPDLPEARKAPAFFKDYFITAKLHDEGFDVETYGDFGHSEEPSTSKLPYYSHLKDKPQSSYMNMLEMSLLRVFPAPERLSLSFNFMWRLLAGPSLVNTGTETEIELSVLTGDDPHPLAHYKLDILQFDAFVNSIHAADVGPTARLHHYLFTHEPIRFSKNCDYVSGTGSGNVTAIPAETNCAIEKLKTILEKLKAAEVFDNTMIIFASDHGPECPHNFTFEPGSYRVSQRWCLSRYQPFLMIKRFDASGRLAVDSEQSSLIDIAATICAATLPEPACAPYSGLDLLDGTIEAQSATRHILVSKSSGDRRDYNDFARVAIPRDQSIVDYFKLDPQEDKKVFPATILPSQTGTKANSKRSASPEDPAGFITYGPYMHLWPGRYSISVVYSLSNDDAESANHWEVTSAAGANQLFKGPLENSQGQTSHATYLLNTEESIANVEVRAFYGGTGSLTIESVTIERHLEK